MPGSSTNEAIIQPNPYAGGQPAPPISLPGQGSQPSSGGSSNNNQGQGQNTITIDDEVSLSGPSTGLSGTPQPSGPSSGGSVQPTNPGTDFNNTVPGMVPGANGSGQNQSSGNATGWWKNGNDWYYFDPVTGNMVKGWKYYNGSWYYLDPKTGIMATGWRKVWIKADGSIMEDGLWYYLEPSVGAMVTDWRFINGEWYFLETTNGNGQMVTGWKFHNEKWYYLFESGAMAHGGWLMVDEKWYCVRDNGELETSKILEYNGKKYYVDENGAMITSADKTQIIYNYITYEVDGDGVCTQISKSSGAAPATATNANIDEWRTYINNSEISTARKTILLAAFDTIKSGCIYHQLRKELNETPSKCMKDCNGKIHPKQVGAYNFDTMANYNVETPLYLDCSFFVKHCYWKAGISMKASNTSGMREKGEFSDRPKEELKPADIALKPGHVVIFVGYTSKGEMVWAEMSCHAENGKLSSYPSEFKDFKKFKGLD